MPDPTFGTVEPLIFFPIGFSAPPDVVSNDLQNVLSTELHHDPGVRMSATLKPFAAAAIGHRDLYDMLYGSRYVPFRRGTFNILEEAPQSPSTNLLSSVGRLLQKVLFWYCGLRLSRKGFDLPDKPVLPREITEVSVLGLYARGRTYDLVETPARASLKPH
ncbi:MAG TPA: hypothetical protein VMG09_05550 [Bacteroidota bacterium]|nr:hypothetical protein [Bacteroidota bacterium]